jgi:hypothetical protein
MGGYYPRNPNKGHTLYKRGFGAQTVSGLSLLWLTQPISAIYNVAFFFYTATKSHVFSFLGPNLSFKS